MPGCVSTQMWASPQRLSQMRGDCGGRYANALTAMAMLGMKTLPHMKNEMIKTYDDGTTDESEDAFVGRVKREKQARHCGVPAAVTFIN